MVMNKSLFFTAMSAFMVLTTLVMSFNVHEVFSWTFWKYNTGRAVSSVAISSNGNYTVAGTENGYLLLLDRQGKSIWSRSLGNEVEGVSISGDGSRILAGLAEYSTGEPDVFLLNKNGDIIWQKDLIQSGRPCDVSISQDSNYIATGDTDNKVRFFDSSGNQLWEKELGDWTTSVSLSSTGDYLAAGSWDDNVYFFNNTGSQIWNYDTKNNVYGVSISPEGGYVASIGAGISFFDATSNQLWNTTSPFGESVSVSANGNFIAAGREYGGQIILLNKTGGEPWNRYVDSDLNSVAITSDGKFVAAGAEDGFVYFIENLQPTSITCEVSKPKLLSEEMPVSGSISPPIEGAEVTLTFTKPDNSTVTVNIQTTAGGIYNGTYVPDMIGSWTVQAFWAGDAEHMGAESPIILFSVGESTITCEVSNWQIYFGESITVSGTIDPPHAGVEVTLTYTNPADTAFNRTVASTGDGRYSDTVLPDLDGMWSVQVSWSGDMDTMGAVSSEVKFLVSTVTEVTIKIGRNQTFSCVFQPAIDEYYSPTFESIVWDRSATSPEGINFTAVEGEFSYHETISGLGGKITSFNITYNIGILEGTSEGVYNATAYYDISSQSEFYPYSTTFLFRYELRCRINAVVKYEASINLSLPPQVKLGEVASVSGTIVSTGGPPVAGVNVTLSYTKPDESVVNRISMTETGGSFQDAYSPDMLGTWSVKASWTGDEDHNGTESLEVPFNVLTDIKHQVTWDMGVYSIHTISNSTISNFIFNGSDIKIGFNVSGFLNTKGFCNVTIPSNFMWGEFTVFLDGSPLTSGINYTQIYNGTHYLFYMLYSQDNSSHEVKISATKIVPEFPSFLILPLFMIPTLIAIAVYKRKRARQTMSYTQ
jgi:hypothetical protein